MMKTAVSLIMVTLTLSWFRGLAQSQDSVTIHYFTAKQAVEYALNNSETVKNALLDIRQQAMTNKEVTAAALPSVNATSSLNINPKVPTFTFPNFIAQSTYAVLIANGVKDGSGNPIKSPGDFGVINAGLSSKYMFSNGIDLNQILFDGQVFVGLMARNAAMRNAELSADVTKEQIKTNVYKLYYQLVVGNRQITSIEANIVNYEQLLHDTKIIFQNGFAEKLDVDKVQVQLSNLQTMKLKARNQIDAGMEGLKFLMGMPMNDSLVLTETLNDDDIKQGVLSEEYHFEDRKEYQQMQTVIELQKLNVKRYQLSRLPSLVLSANYSKSAQGEHFDLFKGPYFTSSFIALRMSVPIFSGFSKNAQIESARISLRQSENRLHQLRSSITNDISQSRLNMKTALYNMDTQEKNVNLAEQVYNSTKLKYEQGVGSNQEISTAQSDLVTAQNNYYSSIYDAIIARIDFLRAAGKL